MPVLKLPAVSLSPSLTTPLSISPARFYKILLVKFKISAFDSKVKLSADEKLV